MSRTPEWGEEVRHPGMRMGYHYLGVQPHCLRGWTYSEEPAPRDFRRTAYPVLLNLPATSGVRYS